tara:strand:+ start:1219 stop:1407 length:189 start_codon:yes stop_codon:yes gene_type:complete
MEDIVIIEAIKQSPNHKLPLKPIDELKIKVDILSCDVSAMKNDLRMILEQIKKEEKKKSGWW